MRRIDITFTSCLSFAVGVLKWVGYVYSFGEVRTGVTSRPELPDMDAIVLAGGQSARMGVPKAHLPFGSSTLIETVVTTLRPVFKTVYVVGRDRERLAGLGATLLIDDRDEQGPLVGLARGLSAPMRRGALRWAAICPSCRRGSSGIWRVSSTNVTCWRQTLRGAFSHEAE